MSTDRDRGYQFRYKLKHLSDNLTSGDLDQLKYLCQDHVKVDDITSGIMLWKALEDCDKLGINNLEYLKELFKSIDRLHLLKELLTPDNKEPVTTTNTTSQVCHPPVRKDDVYLHEAFGSLTTIDTHPIQEGASLVDSSHQPQQQTGYHTPPLTQQVYPPPNQESVVSHPLGYHTPPPLPTGATHLEQMPEMTVPSEESMAGYVPQQYAYQEPYYHPYPAPALPPQPPAYNMDNSSHGLCVIISNQTFTGHSKRLGTEKDAQRMFYLFTRLGYTVDHQRNLKSHQMKEYLAKVAAKDEHKDGDSFVCCILSHGLNNNIFGTDSQLVDIDDLVTPFKGNNCPDLACKPKLFFIQSSRVCKDNTEEPDGAGPKKEKSQYHSSLPTEADFFYGFATTQGSTAYMSKQEGSWYISCLYDVFMQYAGHNYDLLTMHTIINQRVSEMTVEDSDHQQCPAPVSTLRKAVIF